MDIMTKWMPTWAGGGAAAAGAGAAAGAEEKSFRFFGTEIFLLFLKIFSSSHQHSWY